MRVFGHSLEQQCTICYCGHRDKIKYGASLDKNLKENLDFSIEVSYLIEILLSINDVSLSIFNILYD